MELLLAIFLFPHDLIYQIVQKVSPTTIRVPGWFRVLVSVCLWTLGVLAYLHYRSGTG